MNPDAIIAEARKLGLRVTRVREHYIRLMDTDGNKYKVIIDNGLSVVMMQPAGRGTILSRRLDGSLEEAIRSLREEWARRLIIETNVESLRRIRMPRSGAMKLPIGIIEATPMMDAFRLRVDVVLPEDDAKRLINYLRRVGRRINAQ
jgi:hypothetical protein